MWTNLRFLFVFFNLLFLLLFDKQLRFDSFHHLIHRIKEIFLHVARLTNEQKAIVLFFIIELYLFFSNTLEDINLGWIGLLRLHVNLRQSFVVFLQILFTHLLDWVFDFVFLQVRYLLFYYTRACLLVDWGVYEDFFRLESWRCVLIWQRLSVCWARTLSILLVGRWLLSSLLGSCFFFLFFGLSEFL